MALLDTLTPPQALGQKPPFTGPLFPRYPPSRSYELCMQDASRVPNLGLQVPNPG